MVQIGAQQDEASKDYLMDFLYGSTLMSSLDQPQTCQASAWRLSSSCWMWTISTNLFGIRSGALPQSDGRTSMNKWTNSSLCIHLWGELPLLAGQCHPHQKGEQKMVGDQCINMIQEVLKSMIFNLCYLVFNISYFILGIINYEDLVAHQLSKISNSCSYHAQV